MWWCSIQLIYKAHVLTTVVALDLAPDLGNELNELNCFTVTLLVWVSSCYHLCILMISTLKYEM